MAICFWLAVGAGLVSFLICLARRKLPRLSREHLRYYFLTAATRTASANFILYTVVQHIPAGVMSVILGTAPIFTYGLSLSLRMEPFNAARLTGIVVGLVGVVLFVAPRAKPARPVDGVVGGRRARRAHSLFDRQHHHRPSKTDGRGLGDLRRRHAVGNRDHRAARRLADGRLLLCCCRRSVGRTWPSSRTW